MAKRTAGKDLNHENWNEEEEEEEAGTFKVASDAVIKQREIVKAKRRNPTPSSSTTDVMTVGGSTGGAFKGFSFGATKSSGSTNKLFSFGAGGANPLQFSVPSSTHQPTSSASSSSMASAAKSQEEEDGDDNNSEDGNEDNCGEGKPETRNNGDEKSVGANNAEYAANLRALNEGLLDWVTQHVTKNPYCILTPVFEDYKRHLVELDREKDSKCASSSKSGTESNQNGASKSGGIQLSNPLSFSYSPTKQSTSGQSLGASLFRPSTTLLSNFGSESVSRGFSFETIPPASRTSPLAGLFSASSGSGLRSDSMQGLGFSFGSTAARTSFSVSSGIPAASNSTTASSGMFSAGFFTPSSSVRPTGSAFTFSTAPGMGGFSGFGFGTSQPSSTLFGGGLLQSGSSLAEASQGNGEDDEEYEPPKPEPVDVREEGAFYSVRCKLFYMKGKAWADIGLGNLHMKKSGDNDSKTQLIIRADNTIGTILLNIFLPKDMLIKKLSATNVSIVCVPNPPIKGDPDENAGKTLLLKVKSAGDADELVKHLTDNTPK